MPRMSTRDLEKYVNEQGGTLVQLTNGNYNIRKGQNSVNIGKPTNNRWEAAQLRRAWGDATGIPKPD